MADINFNCIHCGEPLTASPPTRPGQNIDCPSCDRRIRVPRKPRSYKPVAVLLIFVVLVALVAKQYLPAKADSAEDAVAEQDVQPTPSTPTAPPEDSKDTAEPETAQDPMALVSLGASEQDVRSIMGDRPDAAFGRGKFTYWTYGKWELTFEQGLMVEKIQRLER